MALLLTSNAILALTRPVLQIVDVRQTGNVQTTAEQFWLVLSDGVNLQRAMLATQLNEKVKNNLAVRGSIVQLLKYMCTTVQNRKILVVLNMEILAVPGPGGVQQQQPLALVSSPSSVADAANSSNGFRSAGSGLGQTLGTGMDNGAGGLNMGQAPSGGHNPHALAGVGYTSEPTGNGAGMAYGQLGQQQNIFGPPTAPARIIPIAALNPYQRRWTIWTIRAWITAKLDIQRFHNAKGEKEVQLSYVVLI